MYLILCASCIRNSVVKDAKVSSRSTCERADRMHYICPSSKLNLFAPGDRNRSHYDGVVDAHNRKHPGNYLRYARKRRPEALLCFFLQQVCLTSSPERRTVASSFTGCLEANETHVAGDKRVRKREAQKSSQKWHLGSAQK